MFNGCEFSFDGKSSLMYGLMLYDIGGKGQEDVPFGNEASIVETRVGGRIQPIHFGVRYNDNPLQFKLVFGALEDELDRYDFQQISMWLTGHQDYKWLTIDQPDLVDMQFRCIIKQLTPITVGWLPYAFEALVVCDCPYAYSAPFSETYTVSGSNNSIVLYNKSSVREYLRPSFHFVRDNTQNGSTLQIVNADDGDRTFLLESIPASAEVEIDNNTGVMVEKTDGTNLYAHFNMNFFRMVPGANNLTVTGDGTLTISGRFLHNVAG